MQIKYRERVPSGVLPCLDSWREVAAELLPCPMCQADGEQVLVADKVVCDAAWLDEEQARGKWAIECGSCGIVLPNFTTAEAAVRGWNNRTDHC